MDISEVARKSGVPASTLRYYEERGLIASNGRSGLKRVFDVSVLEKLAMIALGQAAGFSLDEIAGMFSAKGGPHIDRQALLAKAEEIDALIRKYTVMSNGLKHAAVCPAETHFECPTFKRLLAAAGRGALDVPVKKRKQVSQTRRSP